MAQHDNYTRDILPGQEEALSKIAAKILPNSLVLDVGCGSGMLGKYLASNSQCVIDGADFDQAAVNLAKSIYRKALVVDLESESLLTSFTQETYDFIVVADVIEHLVHPAKLLQDIKLLLKPWGTILFSVPNITHISAGLELLFGRFDYTNNGLLDSTHVHFYSKEGLRERLIQSGIYPWEFDTVERDFDETEFSSHELVPLDWAKQFVESRSDALTYQWIVSAKLSPPTKFEASVKRRQLERRYTTLASRLYFQGLLDAELSEENSLPADIRQGSDAVSHLSFLLSADRCTFPLQALRVDLVSDVRPFIFIGLELLDDKGQTLWHRDAPLEQEMVNAWVVNDPDLPNCLVMPKNNDPQWHLNLGKEILNRIKPGSLLKVSICRDAQLVAKAYIETFQALSANYSAVIKQHAELDEALNAKYSAAITQLTQQLADVQQDVSESRGQIRDLQTAVAQQFASAEIRAAEFDSANNLISALWTQIAEKNAAVNERNAEVYRVELALQEARLRYLAIVESNSWKATRPLRFLKRIVINKPLSWAKRLAASAVKTVWRNAPLSGRTRQILKNRIFTALPFLFQSTAAFKSWAKSKAVTSARVSWRGAANIELHEGDVEFVGRTLESPLSTTPVKLICFYLPQFHEIPENNEWWGEGFTEWTNVRPAVPQFQGHYQPHVPGELGYYDLLDRGVQRRQVDLAKLYGVGGFCFYFYWFAGKTLLEQPVLNYLTDKSLALPFCLCWANENWSRRWDGLDKSILIQQSYSPEDDIAFISHIAQYLRDDRYIKVEGRPLVVVYRPGLLPDARATVARWRAWCLANGVGEIYLAYTQSFESVDPTTYGFDAAIEFPPNNSGPRNITEQVKPNSESFAGTVYDWQSLSERSENYTQPPYKLFRSVCPSWDNTPRRKAGATVFLNSSPEKYERWLRNAVRNTAHFEHNLEKRLVFANAWNEWAEGAHLEPDQKYGYAWLQATRNALAVGNTPRSILLVTHDCHPHGAQFLTLEMGRQFVRNGFQVAILALGGGSLFPEFQKLGVCHGGFDDGARSTPRFLRALRVAGIADAVTSTVVCGSVVPELKAQGFAVLSLIHELPGVIRALKQESNALSIASMADKVVFPAAMVRDGFLEIASTPPEKVSIRPQGLLRKNPYRGNTAQAREEIRKKFGFSQTTRFVVAVGYLDARKGADLFVEIAAAVLGVAKDTAFIWIGHADAAMQKQCIERSSALGISSKVIFAGFDSQPFAYYAAASVYVLTSREDPFPNVVIESASVGVPVVSFSGATGAESFITDHGGAVARANDVAHFADLVLEFLEKKIEDVSFANHDFALQRYILDLVYLLNRQPRISVVVPNFNYAHLIEKRLESIFNQSWPVYELIILDDASSDNSIEIIREFCQRHELDCQIKVNQVNSGSVFRQWHLGAAMASGDILWIAEADDFCEPDFLASLAPQISDSSVVLAYCQSSQINTGGETIGSDYLPYTSELSKRWNADYLESGALEAGRFLCVKNPIPNVSGVLMRRESLLKAFDSIGQRLFEFKVAGDWLIYLHVLLRGNVYYCARPLNAHRRHDGSVTSETSLHKHLAEIVQVQGEVAELCEVPPESSRQAFAYAERVRTQFGLSSLPQSKGQRIDRAEV